MKEFKSYLGCALVAIGSVLVATVASAQIAPPGPLPTSCQLGDHTVEVTGGPSIKNCAESTTGVCTEIEYMVTSKPDHVVVWAGAGIVAVTGDVKNNGVQIFPVGQGDNLTNAGGDFARHEQVARINPRGSISSFKVRLVGSRGKSATSVLVKKGGFIDSCRILGIGLEAGAGDLDVITAQETVMFGDCEVIVSTPPGGGVSVELTQESIDAGCMLRDDGVDLDLVTLTTPGGSGTGLQAEEFSFVSSGSTCWSTVIPTPNGRLYTVCR